MKDIITSREDLLLAKIAGRDVDIQTMTPPVVSNMTEKLMLEIADRLDTIGDGSSETITNIVDYTLDNGACETDTYSYEMTISVLPVIPKNDVYLRVEGNEYPLEYIDGERIYEAGYNYDVDGGTPVDPEKAFFYIYIEEVSGEGNDVLPSPPILLGATTTTYFLTVVTNENIDGEKIELIQKAGGSSGGLFVVDITETEESGETVYVADKTVAEIIAAEAAGQVVQVKFAGVGIIPLYAVLALEHTVMFSLITLGEHQINSLMIVGQGKDGDADEWIVGENYIDIPANLKPTYVVHATESQSGTTVTETYADILEAYNSGATIKAVFTADGEPTSFELPLTAYAGTGFVFTSVTSVEDGLFIAVKLIIEDNDGVTEAAFGASTLATQ